jgi:hypothetical protein
VLRSPAKSGSRTGGELPGEQRRGRVERRGTVLRSPAKSGSRTGGDLPGEQRRGRVQVGCAPGSVSKRGLAAATEPELCEAGTCGLADSESRRLILRARAGCRAGRRVVTFERRWSGGL